jgi:hypothetical protein
MELKDCKVCRDVFNPAIHYQHCPTCGAIHTYHDITIIDKGNRILSIVSGIPRGFNALVGKASKISTEV